MIKLLSWISDCNSVYSVHWEFIGNRLMSTENGVTYMTKKKKKKKKKKKSDFFQQSWDLFSNSFIKTESMAAPFSLFTGLCLASVSKHIQLFTITWVSTALSLCPCYSPDSVSCTMMFACWTTGVCPGLGLAAQWGRASAMIAWGRGRPQYELCWAACHPGHGLDIPDVNSVQQFCLTFSMAL